MACNCCARFRDTERVTRSFPFAVNAEASSLCRLCDDDMKLNDTTVWVTADTEQAYADKLMKIAGAEKNGSGEKTLLRRVCTPMV